MSAKRASKVKGKLTPLMRQYYKIKERHPDAVLLFRMGDFYETFEEDAVTISGLLGITLTKRSNGKASNVPLAGFPYHALDNYLPKLVRAGLRVAVCEQLEDPKMARKVVKRDVVEVVTPGVSFHSQLLDPKRSNYLAAIHWGKGSSGQKRIGFSFLDASTGEFCVTESHQEELPALLQSIAPSEVLIDKGKKALLQEMGLDSFVITPQEDWCFGYDFAYETLLRHFKTHSLKGFGIADMPLGVVAAGAAMYYLTETQKGRVPHIRQISRYDSSGHMVLDPQTKRNLELVASMQHGGQDGTLVQIMDDTVTAMGGRLIRKWLLRPLRDEGTIEKRLEAVDHLHGSRVLRQRLRERLGEIGDLERLAAKICTGRAGPRDLVSLRSALEAIEPIQAQVQNTNCDTLLTLAHTLTPCPQAIDLIDVSIVDDPPAQLKDGGVISEGYNDELDELRAIAKSGKDWVVQLQQEESVRTGIPSLKVGYNKVFGYYLEVTHAHKDKVPDDYIRKQTLVNAERYITPKLKAYEETILTAEEKLVQLESALFQDIREQLAEETAAYQRNASLLAMLDCFCSFAEVADRNRYVRPVIMTDGTLDIENGRHPVVETMLPQGEPFIPNSISLDPAERQIMIITGPNMAGKSVVLRQTGLIVLLAQVGSFVPAKKAHIGLVDRIFTRVGASDNLAAGESTFLVEMNETANILNNATPKSLILLDEVGRGTSTFDGLSIAWALVEYLHEQAQVAAKTLFATHYHELNELTNRFARVRNFRVQVQEHKGKVVFLRKLVAGGADHSYGIEVARMAGLPLPVIHRAKAILDHLEQQHLVIEGSPAQKVAPVSTPAGALSQQLAALPDVQMSLFQAPFNPELDELLASLQELDVHRITPIEALLKLAEIQQKAQQLSQA